LLKALNVLFKRFQSEHPQSEILSGDILNKIKCLAQDPDYDTLMEIMGLEDVKQHFDSIRRLRLSSEQVTGGKQQCSGCSILTSPI